MSTDDDTGDTESRRNPGPITMMKAKEQLDRERAKEEREAAEARDVRQDERTDKAYQLALDAARAGQASAERTVKLLYGLLAASMLANIILVAMWSGSGFEASKDGVKVNGESSQSAPSE